MKFTIFALALLLLTESAISQTKPKMRPKMRVYIVGSDPGLMGSLSKACPNIVLTVDSSNFDYSVSWTSKNWEQTSWDGHQNEVSVYNRVGDLVGSTATHKQGNAAKDVCKILLRQ